MYSDVYDTVNLYRWKPKHSWNVKILFAMADTEGSLWISSKYLFCWNVRRVVLEDEEVLLRCMGVCTIRISGRHLERRGRGLTPSVIRSALIHRRVQAPSVSWYGLSWSDCSQPRAPPLLRRLYWQCRSNNCQRRQNSKQKISGRDACFATSMKFINTSRDYTLTIFCCAVRVKNVRDVKKDEDIVRSS